MDSRSCYFLPISIINYLTNFMYHNKNWVEQVNRGPESDNSSQDEGFEVITKGN